MTPRERVLQAIQFHDTDIVPYQVNLTSGARQNLIGYTGDPSIESKIGNHIATISHRKLAPWDEIRPGIHRDEWGVIWNRTQDKDIGVVENQVLAEPTLDGWDVPDPAAPGVFAKYPEFIDESRDKFRAASIGMSLYERAWSLRGTEHLLMDMYDHPDFVHALFDRITDYNLAQVETALKYDIDCIYYGDDWGAQVGLIMGPAIWHEFIQPRVDRMYQFARQAGKYVMIHSCGDVKAIFPDLIEAGLNIFNPFQPEAMDIYETKKEFHGRLSFYGGISVQHLLPHGTPDEVRTETRRILNELGKGGGYIASPSHSVPEDVPVANLLALIEVLQSQ